MPDPRSSKLTFYDLPPSERIRPRPLLTRLRRRWATNLDPGYPTDAEKHDAILALEEGPEPFGVDVIFEEAQRVLDAAHLDR